MGKKCKKCSLIKPFTDFYVEKLIQDGYSNTCKLCKKRQVKKRYVILRNDPNWIQNHNATLRKKYRLKGIPKKQSVNMGEYKRKYYSKFPEKKAAKDAAFSIDKLFKNAQKHHWSYNPIHFLDVIQMTSIDHVKIHRFLIYDQERKMYRRFDTQELLDTKERHKEFIDHVISTQPD